MSAASPGPLGVHLREDGGTGPRPASAAIHSPDAERIEICLFDRRPGEAPVETDRVELPHWVHGTFFGDLPELPVGQLYGVRAHGPWDPGHGLRFNPAKVLLDPYARAISGDIGWGQAVYSHTVDRDGHPVDGSATAGGGRLMDSTDSAGSVPLGVVLPPLAPATPGPGTSWQNTVIYEAHLKGITQQHPDVPPELRGTWAGLAHPAVLGHLTSLGVTAIELLPVFAHADEPRLAREGLSNYWGYNHLSFFAPHPGYATAAARAGGPMHVVAEVVAAIEAMHDAGLEVLLDVVYNHTCEGGSGGPTFSWRGLGERTYYRLDEQGRSIDFTGTGNTLDFGRAVNVQLVLDSLRHWITAYGVDGFRFDLAPVLGRGNARTGRDGFDPDHPLLVAIRTDPVISRAKLIAEPWDVGPGGWRTGEFPSPFAEWNDRYRDAVRAFWVADRAPLRDPLHGPTRTDLRELATRLAGSSDHFKHSVAADHLLRPAWASINYVTAHDGFTLTDLVSYDRKHNRANGEDNRDGTDNNLSWNHGAEGRTNKLAVISDRHRTKLAALSTLLLSIGTPMLLAGDELGCTQGGNNNAYCQDNPLSWVEWGLDTDRRANAPMRRATLAAVRELLRLRAAHPTLGRRHRPDGRAVPGIDATDVGWFRPDGFIMQHADWHDPALRTLQMVLHGHAVGGDDSIVVALNGAETPVPILLPTQPWAGHWTKEWDSGEFAAEQWPPEGPLPGFDGGETVELGPCTVALFVGSSGRTEGEDTDAARTDLAGSTGTVDLSGYDEQIELDR